MPSKDSAPPPPAGKLHALTRVFGALVWLSVLTAVIWNLVVSLQTGGWAILCAPWWVFLPMYVLGFLLLVPWAIEGRPERASPDDGTSESPAPEARRELSSRAAVWVAWVFLCAGVPLLFGALIYRLCVGPAADALFAQGGALLGGVLTVFGLGIAADRRVKDRGGKAGPNAKG
jgi:hypothetical protein